MIAWEFPPPLSSRKSHALFKYSGITHPIIHANERVLVSSSHFQSKCLVIVHHSIKSASRVLQSEFINVGKSISLQKEKAGATRGERAPLTQSPRSGATPSAGENMVDGSRKGNMMES
jgi:hypothetical protein